MHNFFIKNLRGKLWKGVESRGELWKVEKSYGKLWKGVESLGETEFLLLCFLSNGVDGRSIDSRINALTVDEIVCECDDPLLQSTSTIYKNLVRLVEKGLVSSDGIRKGRCYTYFITPAGKKYAKEA